MPLRKATRFVGQEEVVAPLRKRCDGTSKSIFNVFRNFDSACSMRDPHGGLVLKRFRSCWHKFHRHVDHFKSSGRFTRSLRLEGPVHSPNKPGSRNRACDCSVSIGQSETQRLRGRTQFAETETLRSGLERFRLSP